MISASRCSWALPIMFVALFGVVAHAAEEFAIRSGSVSALIDPGSLRVELRPGGKSAILLSGAQAAAGKFTDLKRDGNKATWTLTESGIEVATKLESERFAISFRAHNP